MQIILIVEYILKEIRMINIKILSKSHSQNDIEYYYFKYIFIRELKQVHVV